MNTTQEINTPQAQGIGRVVELGHPWRGIGPFLFAVHHLDAYPEGNADMGPVNRDQDGWSMYHGETVPGFPAHPHRGFETITVVTQGYVDHADSTGASARYGVGDVQWVTAGGGVSHAEMFPLLNQDGPNPFELYQVWLNLPARDKGAPAEFTMQWDEQIPVVEIPGSAPGIGGARVKVIAGSFGGATALAPPTHSWASDPNSDVALWLVTMQPNAELTLPDVTTDATQRMLYVHGTGATAEIAGVTVGENLGFEQSGRGELHVTAGESGATILVLQAVPINEPVVAHGPFVMNTRDEIVQAFADYQATEFGGWPWPDRAMVHPRKTERFARFGDGRQERPTA